MSVHHKACQVEHDIQGAAYRLDRAAHELRAEGSPLYRLARARALLRIAILHMQWAEEHNISDP